MGDDQRQSTRKYNNGRAREVLLVTRLLFIPPNYSRKHITIIVSTCKIRSQIRRDNHPEAETVINIVEVRTIIITSLIKCAVSLMGVSVNDVAVLVVVVVVERMCLVVCVCDVMLSLRYNGGRKWVPA